MRHRRRRRRMSYHPIATSAPPLPGRSHPWAGSHTPTASIRSLRLSGWSFCYRLSCCELADDAPVREPHAVHELLTAKAVAALEFVYVARAPVAHKLRVVVHEEHAEE